MVARPYGNCAWYMYVYVAVGVSRSTALTKSAQSASLLVKLQRCSGLKGLKKAFCKEVARQKLCFYCFCLFLTSV